jgi:hypothetical protein
MARAFKVMRSDPDLPPGQRGATVAQLRADIDRQGPQNLQIRVGGPTGGTIGLLAHDSANPLGSISMTPEQRAGIHVEQPFK